MKEPSKELVHARYLGDTPVVFKHLASQLRCCQSENHREENEYDELGQLVKGNALVCKGDVILLDRFSAEEREDFEIVDEPKSGKGKTGSKSEKE